MKNDFAFESFESFKHGLVVSKLWLCEQLESIISKDITYSLHVLGGWTNLIGFMLLIRNNIKFNVVHSYDIDVSANLIANKVTDAWRFEEPKVYSHTTDIDNIDYSTHQGNNVYINCSIEHLSSRKWFDKIPKDSIVVLQSTDVNDSNEPWFITDHVPNLETIKNRYPLDIYFSGTKEINYTNFSYKRFMVIGRKI